MGKIILARHGQCKDNEKGIFNGTRDSPLTIEGMHQAHCLGEALAENFQVTMIFTSPKARAIETARMCSTPFWHVEIKTLDYLVERNHGILEGEPYSRVRELAEGWLTHDGFDHVTLAKGAETYEQLYERARLVYFQMLWEVLNLSGGHKDVLFVGHGALFRMIWAIHHGRHIEDSIRDHWKNCEYRVLTKPD